MNPFFNEAGSVAPAVPVRERFLAGVESLITAQPGLANQRVGVVRSALRLGLMRIGAVADGEPTGGGVALRGRSTSGGEVGADAAIDEVLDAGCGVLEDLMCSGEVVEGCDAVRADHVPKYEGRVMGVHHGESACEVREGGEAPEGDWLRVLNELNDVRAERLLNG